MTPTPQWSPTPTASVGHGQMCEAASDFDQVVQERPLREVHAEDLRQLIDDDHDRNPRLEADQHRRRDEICDEAEPQQRCRRSARPPPSVVKSAVACTSCSGIAVRHHLRRAAPRSELRVVVVVLTRQRRATCRAARRRASARMRCRGRPRSADRRPSRTPSTSGSRPLSVVSPTTTSRFAHSARYVESHEPCSFSSALRVISSYRLTSREASD